MAMTTPISAGLPYTNLKNKKRRLKGSDSIEDFTKLDSVNRFRADNIAAKRLKNEENSTVEAKSNLLDTEPNLGINRKLEMIETPKIQPNIQKMSSLELRKQKMDIKNLEDIDITFNRNDSMDVNGRIV